MMICCAQVSPLLGTHMQAIAGVHRTAGASGESPDLPAMARQAGLDGVLTDAANKINSFSAQLEKRRADDMLQEAVQVCRYHRQTLHSC